MLHTRFARRYLWIGITSFSFLVITASAFAQDETTPKKSEQSETNSTEKKKPKVKKTDEKGQEKEKKPKLQLLGSKVSYGMPRRWTKPQVSTRNKLEALQFTIPLPSASIASQTSAIVVAEPNTEKLSLADFSNGKLPRKFPASTVVADQLDGDSWRTIVSFVTEATPPYTVVDRFGVTAGVRVHFRVLLPKEDDTKATWPQTLSQESNAFIDELRIDGKNTVATHLFYDKGNWGLREAKAKSSTAKDATSDSEKAKKVEVKKPAPKKVAPAPTPKKKETPTPSSDSVEKNEL